MKQENKIDKDYKISKPDFAKNITSRKNLDLKIIEETEHIPFVDDKLIGDDFLFTNALVDEKETPTDKETNYNNY